MRTQVTFILRLWIDPHAEPPAWEGRVVCVADGAHAHVRGVERGSRVRPRRVRAARGAGRPHVGDGGEL